MIRLIVRTDNAGMAANVGGAVLTTYATIDIDLPELEVMLSGHPGDSYSHTQLVGAEVITPSNQQAPMTDDELLECARGFRDGVLDGHSVNLMCAAICWPLAGFLRFSGIDCDAEGRDIADDGYPANHVWIRLADGRVLDPTADQFPQLGLPEVYLGKPVAPIHRAIP